MFDQRTVVRLANCSHNYHLDCIKPWLDLHQVGDRNRKCAICSQFVLPLVRKCAALSADVTTNASELKLLNATRGGELEAIIQILSDWPELAGKKYRALSENQGYPLIAFAAQGGHLPVVEFFLGMSQARETQDGDILICAVRGGNTAVVERLLETGFCINAVGTVYGTVQYPLNTALYCDDYVMTGMLIEKGANVNCIMVSNDKRYNGLTPLHQAVRSANIPMTEKLIKFGAEVNVCTFGGRTPLQVALTAKHQAADLVRLLVAGGANIHERGRSGQTPMDLATERGDLEIIDILRHSVGESLDRRCCTIL